MLSIAQMIEALPERISESFKTLFAGVEERLADALGNLKQSEADLAQTRADLVTAKQTIATLQTIDKAREKELADSKAAQATLTAENEKLKAEAKDVNQKAAELLAAQGIPAGDTPAGSPGPKSENAERAAAQTKYSELLSQGKSLEAGQFWAANRKLFS
jgi:septal ring factor EnvC (AmiA/AmiB activator)